jgi:hypothetical protein
VGERLIYQEVGKFNSCPAPPRLLLEGVPRKGQLNILRRDCSRTLNGDTGMSKLTALTTFMVLAVSAAWAQTPAPAPGTAPGSPPAGDAGATGSDLTQYWWVILLVVIAAAAIWYFTRGRSRV